MKNNLIKIETNFKNVNEHLKTAIDNNLEDIYEDTEAEGGHPIPILLSIAHCSKASTASCLLEWSEATCFRLGWGYRILTVKYSIEG